MIRVVVAVDTPLFRGALSALFNRERDINVVGETSNWSEIDTTVRRTRPDIVLLDLKATGQELLAMASGVCRVFPGTRALILLEPGRYDVLSRACEPDLHTLGFVTKQASPDDLVTATRTLAQGSPVIDADLVVSALTSPDNPLTEREQDILSLTAEGTSVPEIATKLYLSVGTVRNYLSRINMKIGADNRIQAIVRARQAGWL